MKKIILFFILLWSVNCMAQGTWSQLQSGLTEYYPVNIAYALCADTINNVLYVGGNFDTAGGIYQQGISKWDGTKWDSLPNNGFTYVDAMVMYNGNLCVGDYYSHYVWRFNGTTWSSSPEFNGGISALCLYKDTLYAAGPFTQSGNTILNHVVKWDGSQWQPLRLGINYSFLEVNAMTVYHDTLFVGGFFYGVDSLFAYSIAKWDGTHWSAVGNNGITDWSGSNSRASGYVFSLGTFQGDLYIGGYFDSAGGIAANSSIADWNGSNWDTLSIPTMYVTSEIYALKFFNKYLFMGSNGQVGFISKYDGSTFSTVDSGVNVGVHSFSSLNGSLYVGGEFDTAGKTIRANGIAKWTPDSTTTKINQLTNTNFQLTIYPNPFSQQAIMQFSQPLNNNAQITLYDLIGREVENYTILSGVTNLIIKRNNLPAAMYFYKLYDYNMPPITGKIVIE